MGALGPAASNTLKSPDNTTIPGTSRTRRAEAQPGESLEWRRRSLHAAREAALEDLERRVSAMGVRLDRVEKMLHGRLDAMSRELSDAYREASIFARLAQVPRSVSCRPTAGALPSRTPPPQSAR